MIKSNLRAYYLQQLGIDNWVQRSVNPLKNGERGPLSEVMIVLENGQLDPLTQWPSASMGQLLMNILKSMGVSPEKTRLVDLEGGMVAREATLKQHVKDARPRFILICGEVASEFLHNGSHGIPLLQASHPIDLLKNPLNKKQLFINLASFSNFFGE